MPKKEEKNRLDGYKETCLIDIDGTKMVATIREFKTGSIGYNFAGKVVVDGKKCQVTGNIVIVGTKPEEKK